MTRLLHTLFVGPIGRLPYWMLYPIADGLAAVLWLTGYRKKVVLANLAGVFPEKSEAERTRIARDFFTHLAEVLMESLKHFRADRADLAERFHHVNPEVLAALCRQHPESPVLRPLRQLGALCRHVGRRPSTALHGGLQAAVQCVL